MTGHKASFTPKYMGCKNKEEYDFFKELKICIRCKKEMSEPNKIMCWECQDKEREYDKSKRLKNLEQAKQKDKEKYKRLKVQGICTYCKHEKVNTNTTKCSKCLSKIRNKRRNNKCDIERSERVSYGICYICGKNPLIKGKGVCQQCYQVRLKSINKIMYMRVNDSWKQENNKLFAANGYK